MEGIDFKIQIELCGKICRDCVEDPDVLTRYTGLDALFGAWSAEEADEFDEALRELREMDKQP